MEAIAALGFACNVIQLVETGCKTASLFRQAYKDGTTKHNSDLKSTTQNLSGSLQEFKQTRSSQLKGREKELFELGCEVVSISESLYDVVQQCTEDGSASTRKKIKSGWRSLRNAGVIKEYEAKLKSYRETLDTIILVDLRKRLVLADVHNHQEFSHLGQRLQKFIQDQAILQSKEHQKTQAIVQYEGAVTRAHLGAKLNALAIGDERQAARQQLMNSLRFPDMNKRKSNISDNHEGTFEWILGGDEPDEHDGSDHDDNNGDGKDDGIFWQRDLQTNDRRGVISSQFTDWLSEGSNNYWICGKAGSGKSTLMRFISEHKSTRSHLERWTASQQLGLVEVYIWNAGSELQKSYRGILATMLFQLLQQADLDILDSLTCDQKYQRKHSIADWHTKELESLILALIKDLPRYFCFFIDGLDELEVQQQSEDDEILLRFIKRISSFINVKCCLSSRPERLFEVSFRDTKQLRLERLNENDIRRLCGQSLRQAVRDTHRTLSKTELEDMRSLVDTFVERAGGVFLWAHLVLGQLRRGIRAHDEVHELHKYLDSLPSGIVKLYEHMLARNNEDLLQHREEAANFINIVLLPTTVNLVQFALTFEDKLQDSSAASLNSADVVKICAKLKERISVRSAGLVHVTEETEPTYRSQEEMYHNSFPDEIKSVRMFTVQLVHRTAKDFLLTEPAGKEIRSEASLSDSVLSKRFFHALLLESSMSRSLLSFRWLQDFASTLRTYDDLLCPADNVEVVNQLENDLTRSLQKHLVCKDTYSIFWSYLDQYTHHNNSLRMLFVLDFNAWVLRCGSSPSMMSLIQRNSNRLNPRYCAYLLCMFDVWYIVDVDSSFYDLVLALLQRLEPTEKGINYVQCSTAYPSASLPAGDGSTLSDDKSVSSDNESTSSDADRSRVSARSGVRCSMGEKLIKLMFGHYISWKNRTHFQQVLPLATSFLDAPFLQSTGLSIICIENREGQNCVSMYSPDGTTNIKFGFLIEFDMREVFRWYLSRWQTLHDELGQYDGPASMTLPAGHRWNIVVKAITCDTGDTFWGHDCSWRKLCATDHDVMSEILSRLPIVPCSLDHRFLIDHDDPYWMDLIKHTEDMWSRSPAEGYWNILADMEYLIPPDDPRVLRQAPPMFLDTPLEKQNGSKNEDEGGSEDGNSNIHREDEDEDEDDEFFDAVD